MAKYVSKYTGAKIDELLGKASTASTAVTTLQAADETLQKNIDAEAAARTAADETLQAGIDDINARLYPTVAVGDLDTLTEGATDTTKSRYLVTLTFGTKGNVYVVGTLDVLSDSNGHVFTQVLTTHCTMEDGVLNINTHRDDYVFQYYRSYKRSNSGTLDIDVSTWTEWKTMGDQVTDQLSAQIALATKDYKAADETLQSNIDAINDKVGAADGIATLDAYGIISEEQLPYNTYNDVLYFDGFYTGAVVPKQASANAKIYFCTAVKRLLSTDEDESIFCIDWEGCQYYGECDTSGVTPFDGKLYVDRSTNKAYWWDADNSTLVAVKAKAEELSTTYGGETIDDAWMQENAEAYFAMGDGFTCTGAHIVDIDEAAGSAMVRFSFTGTKSGTVTTLSMQGTCIGACSFGDNTKSSFLVAVPLSRAVKWPYTLAVITV